MGRGSCSDTDGVGVAPELLNLHPTPAANSPLNTPGGAWPWLSVPGAGWRPCRAPSAPDLGINVQLQLQGCSSETAELELLALELPANVSSQNTE